MPTWCRRCDRRWGQGGGGLCRSCHRATAAHGPGAAAARQAMAARWRATAPPPPVRPPGRSVVADGVEFEVVWDGR